MDASSGFRLSSLQSDYRSLRAALSPRVACVHYGRIEAWFLCVCRELLLSESDLDELMRVTDHLRRPASQDTQLLAIAVALRHCRFDSRVRVLYHAQLAKRDLLGGLLWLVNDLSGLVDGMIERDRLRLRAAWVRRLRRHLRQYAESPYGQDETRFEALLLLAEESPPIEARALLLQAYLLRARLNLKPEDERNNTLQLLAARLGVRNVCVLGEVVDSSTKIGGTEKSPLDQTATLLSAPIDLRRLPVPAAIIADRLRARFPWAEAAVEAIEDDLLINEAYGEGVMRLQPLLLVDPPGVGKTALLNALALALHLPVVVISAGGATSTRILTGTARGWGTQCTSLPVELMARYRVANPLLIIDEIEKEATSNHNGRFSDGMLGFLEPENARRYFDEGLARTVDVSWCNWAATCNDLEPIRAPLLSRLRVVAVGTPEPQHGPLVTANVLDALRRQYQLPDDAPMLDDEGLDTLDQLYRKRPSARSVAHETRRQFSRSLRRRLSVADVGEPRHG